MTKSIALMLLVHSLAASSRAARMESDDAGNLVASVPAGNKVLIKEGSEIPVDVLGDLKVALRKTFENAASSVDNTEAIANNTKKIGNAAKNIGDNTKDIATNLEKITLARRGTAANGECDAGTAVKMTAMVGTLADLIQSTAEKQTDMVGTLANLIKSTAEKQTDMIGTLANIVSSSSSANSDSETTAALHADIQCGYSDDDGVCYGDGEHMHGNMVAFARNLVPTDPSAPHKIYSCDFTFANPTTKEEVKLAKASSTTAAVVEHVPNSDSAYKVTCKLPVLAELAVGTDLNIAFTLKAGCGTIALPKCSSGPWSYKLEKVDRAFYYLIVGGGGGGGGGRHHPSLGNGYDAWAGGGGGAGGYKASTPSRVSLSPGDKLIAKVGKGGDLKVYPVLRDTEECQSSASCNTGVGGAGGQTSLTIEYADDQKSAINVVDGGGGGGDGADPDGPGADGGSGGGAGGCKNQKPGGDPTDPKYGHQGGSNDYSWHGSGGGGAGSEGGRRRDIRGAGQNDKGLGGNGVFNDITGKRIEYAKGGDGGIWHGEFGAADPKVPFTGEGGEGARGECEKGAMKKCKMNLNSASGGSGVVIIRIQSKAYTGKTTGTVSVATTDKGLWTVLTFHSDVETVHL